jgi:aminoglycoside phosphotransferase (APT) family kinase protein
VSELDPTLRAWVEAETGVAVSSAEPIGSGASRQIWLLDLADGDDAVVRLDTGDGPVADTPLTLAREADVYRGLAPTDLPVPALRAEHPDGTALLMDRAAGTERFDDVVDSVRASVAEDYGRCLGRLHRLDPASLALGALAVADGADPTVADLELWRSIDAARCGAASSPSAQVALAQLAASVPATARPSLCHGDAGPGNFLHEGGRVSALLDWEFAHVGDGLDDLAWVAVRNQLLGRPLDVAALIAAWRATTGRSIELERLEWFRALVLTRMLISCEAALAWAGPDAPSAQVQATLHPFLALGIFEALRRAGCADATSGDAEASARAAWEPSLIAQLLPDPTELDDLGALL